MKSKQLPYLFLALVFLTLSSCAPVSPDRSQGEEGLGADPVRSELTLSSVTSKLIDSHQKNARYAIASSYGAVATVNPVASELAFDVLEAGGTAVDAAIQAAYALGVVDSHNSGIGGGCFILVRYADGRIEAIDGREMAPSAAHEQMYRIDGVYQRDLSRTGILAVGIPGSVAAYELMHKEGGRIDLATLILRAADVAQAGFRIDNTFASRLVRVHDTLSSQTSIFSTSYGEPLQAGERLVQAELATTYRNLARYGKDYFYGSEESQDSLDASSTDESASSTSALFASFASRVAELSKSSGGIITEADFAAYEVLKRQPVSATVGDYRVFGYPPPSSGGTHVIQALQMLSTFDQKKMSEADRLHYMLEVLQRVFADRAVYMGDADFEEVPLGLLDEQYARKLAAEISPYRASQKVAPGNPYSINKRSFNAHDTVEDGDKHTTHISVVDAEGTMVAITTTLNTPFGSKVVVPGTGVLLNNQMDDFTTSVALVDPKADEGGSKDSVSEDSNYFGLKQGAKNHIKPGKRPLSSMSPTLVVDSTNGRPVLALGAAGGPTIISQVVQVLNGFILLDQSLDTAMESPRVHHQWSPPRGLVDGFTSADVKKALSKRGHELRDWPSFGGTNAAGIIYPDDETAPKYQAVTEPRLISRNSQ